MSPIVPISLVLAVALPVAWFTAEFSSKRWLRILFGFGMLANCVLLAFGFSCLERFNYNAWYGGASERLIDTTISEIEAGRSDELLTELRRLHDQFQPTYENRGNYDKLVEQFVNRVKAKNPTTEPSDSELVTF